MCKNAIPTRSNVQKCENIISPPGLQWCSKNVKTKDGMEKRGSFPKTLRKTRGHITQTCL